MCSTCRDGSGSAGWAVLELANRARALLITADKDFGELVFRQRRISQGVVLLRLAGLEEAEKSGCAASM